MAGFVPSGNYEKLYTTIPGGKTGNTGGGNSTEQWWGHVDRVEKMREEVRVHREKFLAERPYRFAALLNAQQILVFFLLFAFFYILHHSVDFVG